MVSLIVFSLAFTSYGVWIFCCSYRHIQDSTNNGLLFFNGKHAFIDKHITVRQRRTLLREFRVLLCIAKMKPGLIRLTVRQKKGGTGYESIIFYFHKVKKSSLSASDLLSQEGVYAY